MHSATFTRLLHRPKDSHKYSFGHVLVIGGSSGMVGAPFLAAQAALRVGAGLVTITSDELVIEKLERRVVEIMTLALSTRSAQSVSPVEEYIKARKVSVLVIGPGLTSHAAPLVNALLRTVSLPIVLDGGALGIVAADRNALKQRATSQLILTPHVGELQRFFEQPLPKSQSALVSIAKDFAVAERLTLIVKGSPTHTITVDGTVTENDSGGPALATAGTGDVLSGMIGGIIAQGIAPEAAAPAAVYLHGAAGDLAAQSQTEPGVIASDVIDCIPKALKEIQSALG
jgi:hydroxyethylthiazole kinase-like uncharacterized protein yjeF